jgi:predicted NBD/HSP70 family sugar kinase
MGVPDLKGVRDSTNLNRLLNLIRLHAPVSRPELATESGLSPATVLALTNELAERGLVLEKGTASGQRGRRPMLLEIDPVGCYAIGLTIWEDETVGLLVNLHGSVVSALARPLKFIGQQSAQTIERLAQLVEDLISQSDIAQERLIGVGCAVSGYVDSQNGINIDNWHLGWHKFALGPLLSARLQMPVLVRNNVQCMAYYEHLFGRGQAYQNMLTIALGRGLGMGIVLNGEIFSGSTGGAGEFGHMVAVVGGRRCECGNNGCLEEYVAHRGLLTTYKEMLTAGGFQHPEPTLEQLFQSPPEDEIASLTFQKAGQLFGAGLVTLVNLFNPECLIITGETMPYGDRFFESALQMLRQHAFSQLARSVEVILEPWSGDERWTLGARGAGALVLSQFLFAPPD